MTMEERLMAMEQRMAALETENARLKARGREPEALSSLEIVRIKELARDVLIYGFDAAMAMHGREVAPRGRPRKKMQ